ncbi:hypothetical protein [Isoalcanivorax pacificus]|uniref:hypothetical protein n=1 Tax=Isoalcanivorax pacificus TaxID=1306787 RepID=UPI0011846F22|nr:hypothetical protein [Isoalcanivorax pacificus]
MPIRTSRATALSVLRRLAGLVLIACTTTAHGGDLPERGMTKSAVERAFGAPGEKRAPVGQPPISRWVYPDFTVYFEGDYTLHAVSHQPPPTPAAVPEVVSGPSADTPAEQASPAESRSEYRFDPATGQIIPLGDDAAPPAPQAAPVSEPADVAPAQTAPAEPAPAAPEAPEEHADRPAEQDEGKRPARFRFDPASGRIIMDDGQPPATANPGGAPAAASEPAQSEPAATPDTAAPPAETAVEPTDGQENTPSAPQEAPADDNSAGGFRMQW